VRELAPQALLHLGKVLVQLMSDVAFELIQVVKRIVACACFHTTTDFVHPEVPQVLRGQPVFSAVTMLFRNFLLYKQVPQRRAVAAHPRDVMVVRVAVLLGQRISPAKTMTLPFLYGGALLPTRRPFGERHRLGGCKGISTPI
jgi:hypothetical protein